MRPPSIITEPAFTVVMPCYRAGATIATAIGSVLAQTERDFELIVVDDGCPEGSAIAARAAIGGDRRGRVVRQANAGPAQARNAGAAAGAGRLVAFLDADDRWVPGLLAAHRARFAADPGLGAAFGRLRFYDPSLVRPGRISAHHPDVGLGHAMAETPNCSTSNLVVRRPLFASLGGFDAGMTHAEDQELLVRILASTSWRVGGIDAELVHYRCSPAGLSADLGAMERGWEMMMERARGYADPAAYRAAEPRARALSARYLARRALRTGQPARKALRHLVAACRHDPRVLLSRRTLLTAAGVAGALLLPRPLVQPLVSR